MLSKTLKKCSKCNYIKPLAEFYKYYKNKDKHKDKHWSQCIKCNTELQNKQQNNN